MKEDNKDKTWKDKTGRKYQSYGVEQRLEQNLHEQQEKEERGLFRRTRLAREDVEVWII